jgi:two-component system, cell cycle sensor histidine kinase and response regulator CckA
LNLVVNARDAMPAGGALTLQVRTGARQAEPGDPAGSGHAEPVVLLEVADTGCGMTEEVMERLFEPFFTTKPLGKGTGLGLATSYGIVQQCGGAITACSQPGSGSRFTVALPLVEENPMAKTADNLDDEQWRGSETILLVEDDRGLRDLAQRLLTHAGYCVLAAEDGDRALRCARARNGSPLHLLLTDVVMPRMAGNELAERLTREHASMKVLYTSGHPEEVLLHRGVVGKGIRFLQKPFTSRSLLQQVRKTLDESMAG